MIILRSILKGFIFLRSLLILPGVHWKDSLFLKDIHRWKEILGIKGPDYITLGYILWYKPEFRNLFIYRNSHRIIYREWVKCIYKPMNTLFIESEAIGGGLFIQHGFSTMISAKKIGENCWINQQVTIGYRDNGNPPIIGNNVAITCGAKVLGDIKVGDNSKIGANAVVIRDVEEGSVMVGIPAKRIK